MSACLEPGQLGSACMEVKGKLCLRQLAFEPHPSQHAPESAGEFFRAVVFFQVFAR